MKRGLDRQTLRNYLSEKTLIRRLDILKIALVGMFCGAILGILFGLAGLF